MRVKVEIEASNNNTDWPLSVQLEADGGLRLEHDVQRDGDRYHLTASEVAWLLEVLPTMRTAQESASNAAQ